MKNITVFYFLVTIYLLTVFPVSGFELKGYSFSVAPQLGFVYGQALEYVYQDNRNDNEFLSELKWDIKPIYYAGLEIDFKKTDIMEAFGFFSLISFKAGIPGDSGIHENRDWQSKTHSNITDFSRHTNKTREFYCADISIGAVFPVNSLFFKPFIAGSWMHFSFSGRNGYGEYPPGTPPIYFTGQTVISYKQDWLLTALGLTFGTKFLYPLTIDFTVKASPFTYCIAEDRHLTTKNTYNDYTSFGIYFEPGCSVSYTWKKIYFCLDVNYRYIGQTRGVTYINDSSYTATNDSGAGLYMLDTRLLVKFKI